MNVIQVSSVLIFEFGNILGNIYLFQIQVNVLVCKNNGVVSAEIVRAMHVGLDIVFGISKM